MLLFLRTCYTGDYSLFNPFLYLPCYIQYIQGIFSPWKHRKGCEDLHQSIGMLPKQWCESLSLGYTLTVPGMQYPCTALPWVDFSKVPGAS